MSTLWIKKPDIAVEQQHHLLVLHTKCRRNYRDYYIADLILALLRNEKKVTLCTAEMNNCSPIMNVEDENDNLYFLLPWKYLPRSLFGYLPKYFLQLKLLWLIVRLILSPPSPRPRLIITDTNSTVIPLLKMVSSYKVIYLKHFSDLHSGDHFYEPTSIIPSSAIPSITRADEIVVQTECLKEMLKRSLPRVNNTLSVLNPCYDTGLWLYETLDVESILPMLPMENFLFVVFGEYKPRTNFSLVLLAMDFIVRFMKVSFSVKMHLVVAGYSVSLSSEEQSFFRELQQTTDRKLYGNNVTLLKHTSVLEQKTLIKNCTAVLNPTNFNVFPGPILMAMNMNKPIISVNNGFAKQVLKHNVTGFLCYNIPSIFATKMVELAINPSIGEAVAENAKREFNENYSFHAYCRQLNEIVDNHLNF